MFSIVTSSYKAEQFAKFSDNVAATIGLPYEIIRIDNPGLMGIAEAYNKGAEKAIYEIICFCHDDIEFLDRGWAQNILNGFDTAENIGLMGMAGCRIKSCLPTGWSSGIPEYDFTENIYTIDHRPVKGYEVKWDSCVVPVKVVDGLFIAMTKKLWREFHFNEAIKGFHFYDIDMSLRISESYQNYIVSNIKVAHASAGNFNDEWMAANIWFHKYAFEKGYQFSRVNGADLARIRQYWYRRLTGEDLSLGSRIRFAKNMNIGRSLSYHFLRFLWG